MRRAVTVVLLAACLAPAPARGHDSLAPSGATHNWLPEEEWVGRHWVPFDEQALKAELGLTRRDLHAYLYNDHRVLAALSDDPPEVLADRLLEPWQHIGEAHRAVLRERTVRILTQGHLAQHMFFHVFHGAALHTFAHDLLGMDAARYRHHREEQLTYVQIAGRGGVPVDRLRSGLHALFEADRQVGVERLESWPSEADRIHARRTAWVECWITRPPPGGDPANPYGKNRHLHGIHAASWPSTARERRSDDARVERFRRALPKSCWPIPPRWSR